MPVHFEKWSCQVHYNIIAKAVELRKICFFAKVNTKVVYIAIFRVGHHPEFDDIFCWFCRHVLPEGKPEFECNHSIVNREVFRGLMGFLDILQNSQKDWVNLLKTIIIIFTILWLCC